MPSKRSDARNFSAQSRPDRFSLTGPSPKLDPRIHAVRRDIADVTLADRVFAPHYALPLDHGCIAATVAIRSGPSSEGAAVSELLRGETFAAVDWASGWVWGYGRHDGYVGYVPIAALGAVAEPTHIVSAPAALVFASADIKAPLIERLPMGARLEIDGSEGDFLRAEAGFVHTRHLSAIGDFVSDPVDIAERLIGTPYLWGGRSGSGIDCSGLVQLSFAFAGMTAPRDSDQQRDALGTALADDTPAQRGDLVFLPGHVGLMADDTHLVHANAWWMAVVREPLADVLARQPEGKGILARRRMI